MSWPHFFSSLRGQLTAFNEHFVIGVTDRKKVSFESVQDAFKKMSFF
jgi:hypothetical protein